MILINLGIEEFFGIFLIGFPLFIYLTIVLQWGIFKLFENLVFSKDDDLKNYFHHHYHYKAKK